MLSPSGDFSDSDQDADEGEVEPEEDLDDGMVAMEGEEDLEEDGGLGKSFLAASLGFVV